MHTVASACCPLNNIFYLSSQLSQGKPRCAMAGAPEPLPPPPPRLSGCSTRKAKTLLQHNNGAGLAREVSVLFWRAFTDIKRTPSMLLLHVILAIMAGKVLKSFLVCSPTDTVD